MGVQAQAAYDVGVALGIASFQASVRQDGFAYAALDGASAEFEMLVQKGLLPGAPVSTLRDYVANNRAHLPTQNGTLALLTTYRAHIIQAIGARSHLVGEACSLGLDMGLAEGQATSPDWQTAAAYANAAIGEAQTILLGDLRNTLAANDIEGTVTDITDANASQNQGNAYSDIQVVRLSLSQHLAKSLNLP